MAASTLKQLACLAPFLTGAIAAPWAVDAAHTNDSWTIVGEPVPTSGSALPVVDLGYEMHQAIAFNDTGAYYNFTNIRYARAPTGNLRFRAPQMPLTNRSAVQDGSAPRICPQATPSWILSATTWITNYLEGQPLNVTLAQTQAANASINTANALAAIPPVAGTTEDCLFLDVMVPQKVFENKQNCSSTGGSGAAVLVWIYGGGYTEGSKSGSGDPAGLIERSMYGNKEGVIYVAMNYRLGAFGWLAGPTFQADGTANAGLYDQRFALQWVQDNIHLFGGDPTKVTVFGESAGGGSIMHQITAYAGRDKAPFAQAIMQSPGFAAQASNDQVELQYDSFLSIANVSNLSQLRSLSTEQLQAANTVAVWQSRYGFFDFGPAVDGYFVPAMPGKLLLDGNFYKNLKIMVGHNSDEGLLFTDPFLNTTAAITEALHQSYPAATDAVISYITDVLYPASEFPDPIARYALLVSESTFTCNTRYFDLAFNNRTFSYYFNIPPGLHGSDIPYTYFNGVRGTIVNETAAIALQDWIVTFAEGGAPKSPDVPNAPAFSVYGANSTVENLGPSSITRTLDTVANSRCAWWQKALYA